MNFKNLIMWGIIVMLSVGLFNLFQDPSKINQSNNKVAFSKFLSEVESGRVLEYGVPTFFWYLISSISAQGMIMKLMKMT